MALGLSEGTGMFCSAEAYIIAKSIVIRDVFIPARGVTHLPHTLIYMQVCIRENVSPVSRFQAAYGLSL